MNYNKKAFVSKELAKKLKELGFHEPVYKMVRGGKLIDLTSPVDINDAEGMTGVPTKAHAQDWFRTQHNIEVEPAINITAETQDEFGYGVSVMTNINNVKKMQWVGLNITGIWFKSYDKALEAGLLEAAKLIK